MLPEKDDIFSGVLHNFSKSSLTQNATFFGFMLFHKHAAIKLRSLTCNSEYYQKHHYPSYTKYLI